MIKRLTEHSIYEVWNSNVAESAFFQHQLGKKPTQADLIDIVIKEQWVVTKALNGVIPNQSLREHIKQYIKDNIHVFKLTRFYTNS